MRKTLKLIGTSIIVLSIFMPAARAQIVNSVPFSQDDLIKESPAKQGDLLAQVVREARSVGSNHCETATATLKKQYKEGNGGWLVRCDGSQDQWVMIPPVAGKGAVVLDCVLLKATTGTDCYTGN